MGPHKVISAFKHRGRLIEPPCEWTPPNDVAAARLIKAGCLKEIAQPITERAADIRGDASAAPLGGETERAKAAAAGGGHDKPKGKGKGGKRGIR